MKYIQMTLPLRHFRFVQCSAANPDDPHHHIRRRANGYWQLRFTVDRGRIYVGQRVVIGLRTRSEQDARDRRDLILATMKKARMVRNEALSCKH